MDEVKRLRGKELTTLPQDTVAHDGTYSKVLPMTRLKCESQLKFTFVYVVTSE